MYYPEQFTGGLAAHRVNNVYCFATDLPNYYVDISTTIERKIAALLLHTSQIGGREIGEFVRARARAAGLEVGVEYAEAYHYLPMLRPPDLRRLPNW